TINGFGSGSLFNGTQYSVTWIGGSGGVSNTPQATSTVAQFYFKGDLNIPAGSTVNGTGRYGISLYAADDVNASNVKLNFHGSGTQPGAGGGAGAGVGGFGAGGGGSSSLDFTAPTGSGGGSAGDGSPGAAGRMGPKGGDGFNGGDGTVGSPGINNSGSGG